MKLQLNTESSLCYLSKLEAIKSKIRVFRKFKTIPKSATRESWNARKIKIANVTLQNKRILKVAVSRRRDGDDLPASLSSVSYCTNLSKPSLVHSLNFMVGSLFNFGAVPFHQQIKECYYTLCNIGICSPKLAEYHL